MTWQAAFPALTPGPCPLAPDPDFPRWPKTWPGQLGSNTVHMYDDRIGRVRADCSLKTRRDLDVFGCPSLRRHPSGGDAERTADCQQQANGFGEP